MYHLCTGWRAVAAMLLCIASGCTLATGALRSIGIPIGDGVVGAAMAADAAGINWLLWLIGAGAAAGTAKGAQVVVRKRRARAATKQEAKQ